jgi:protein ImuA
MNMYDSPTSVSDRPCHLNLSSTPSAIAFARLRQRAGLRTAHWDSALRPSTHASRAAAALFVAGIMARTTGKILWCVTRRGLFAPALAQAGLHPDRVIYAEVGDEQSVLACFEEGLRHGGMVGVVGEVAKLSMTASRRLQLVAEGSGTLAIAIRRWRRMTEASDFGQPTASVTRWRISALPSAPLPVPGIGRPRWLVELIRARAGECADFIVEACDEQGRLAIPADVANRPAATRIRSVA